MEKVINKKILVAMFTIVLAFCWLSIPASAAEVIGDADCIAEGVSITRVGDVASPQWGGSIDSLMFEELTVKAYGGKGSNGKPITYEINGLYGYAEGPTSWMYCSLPADFYDGMLDLNLNKLYCTLRFSVVGSELKRYTLKVNDSPVVTKSISGSGEFEVNWISSLRHDTEFCIVVETPSTQATIWGRIRVE